MQMTREDKALLTSGKLPEHAVWVPAATSRPSRKRRNDLTSNAKVAFGTDCGMFPFTEGVLEFQAMVGGVRARARDEGGYKRRGELLQRDDLGAIAPGRRARHRRDAGKSSGGYCRHGEGGLRNEGRPDLPDCTLNRYSSEEPFRAEDPMAAPDVSSPPSRNSLRQ